MEIEKTRAETLCFAIYDVKYLHLLAFAQADEAHERQLYREVCEVSESMLTIDLREHLASVPRYGERRLPVAALPD
ncbi:hypothetical protein BK022_21695 [Methylorubrum extorquens]|uniref:Uncharacterized protein n=1 Tax=Methylorubrum extorquens TaxID=408 RepID=A0A1S1NWI5_METEX|nr:hypothetical protein BK022_21695 [Methylorubrum extorquens]